MKRLGKGLATLVLAFAVLFAVCWGIGTRVERTHAATVTVELGCPPERAWHLVRAIEESPRWRDDVESAARLADRDGRPVYEQTTAFGTLVYAVDVDEPPRRLVTRILDNPDFGGTWTYWIEPTDGGCRVTLTERGEIHSPFFRFVARYVTGYDAVMQSYLDALEREVSE